MSATDHYDEAVRLLERADYVANAEGGAWGTERQTVVANYLARAQVHATLQLANDVREAGNVNAKATYDGRI